MGLELTITAKGQVTLRRAVLDHLGVTPGAKVGVSLLENGRIELVAAAARDDIKSLRGALRRSGQRPVSLEEMQALRNLILAELCSCLGETAT